MKKAEIRTLLQNIDKETAATITFDEFLEMATPKIQNRDEREEIMKVRGREGCWWLSMAVMKPGGDHVTVIRDGGLMYRPSYSILSLDGCGCVGR